MTKSYFFIHDPLHCFLPSNSEVGLAWNDCRQDKHALKLCEQWEKILLQSRAIFQNLLPLQRRQRYTNNKRKCFYFYFHGATFNVHINNRYWNKIIMYTIVRNTMAKIFLKARHVFLKVFPEEKSCKVSRLVDWGDVWPPVWIHYGDQDGHVRRGSSKVRGNSRCCEGLSRQQIS